MLRDIIPDEARRAVYITYAIIVVILGAISVAYGVDPLPEWHERVSDVVLYLGVAVGVVAASNVPKKEIEK